MLECLLSENIHLIEGLTVTIRLHSGLQLIFVGIFLGSFGVPAWCSGFLI